MLQTATSCQHLECNARRQREQARMVKTRLVEELLLSQSRPLCAVRQSGSETVGTDSPRDPCSNDSHVTFVLSLSLRDLAGS
jgi:hypothetical protein